MSITTSWIGKKSQYAISTITQNWIHHSQNVWSSCNYMKMMMWPHNECVCYLKVFIHSVITDPEPGHTVTHNTYMWQQRHIKGEVKCVSYNHWQYCLLSCSFYILHKWYWFMGFNDVFHHEIIRSFAFGVRWGSMWPIFQAIYQHTFGVSLHSFVYIHWKYCYCLYTSTCVLHQA